MSQTQKMKSSKTGDTVPQIQISLNKQEQLYRRCNITKRQLKCLCRVVGEHRWRVMG